MKKILVTIVLSLLVSFNANADVKWPKFMTKEIPKELIDAEIAARIFPDIET